MSIIEKLLCQFHSDVESYFLQDRGDRQERWLQLKPKRAFHHLELHEKAQWVSALIQSEGTKLAGASDIKVETNGTNVTIAGSVSTGNKVLAVVSTDSNGGKWQHWVHIDGKFVLKEPETNL